MNKKIVIAVSLVTAVGIVSSAWYFSDREPHKHELVKATDMDGKTYWTCPMHPQVHLDHPGNCPICGMSLIEKQQKPAAMMQAPAERKVLYWYDPMQPGQHFDKPGKSPFMDMDLVPKYADPAAPATSGAIVQINPAMAQNLGMRIAEARSGDFEQSVDAVGTVAIDENRIVAVESRAAGWIERLNVRTVGETVRRGQAIAGIYSPELLAAQQELALAQKLDDPTLIDASRQRLNLLGVNNISSKGPQRRVTISAPQSGVVTELLVREGAQVTPGMPLMNLADLSQVWIIVEIPEAQAASIKAGQSAQATLKSEPGRTHDGKVEYVYPILDPQTRTLKARLSFKNSDGALKPGMFAQVSLRGNATKQATLIPAEAVIRTGTRNVVLLAEDAGRYRPVEVKLGAEHAGETEVLEGLMPGQKVVVSGQFLLDSEASLLGAYQRMNTAPPGNDPASGDHP